MWSVKLLRELLTKALSLPCSGVILYIYLFIFPHMAIRWGRFTTGYGSWIEEVQGWVAYPWTLSERFLSNESASYCQRWWVRVWQKHKFNYFRERQSALPFMIPYSLRYGTKVKYCKEVIKHNGMGKVLRCVKNFPGYGVLNLSTFRSGNKYRNVELIL